MLSSCNALVQNKRQKQNQLHIQLDLSIELIPGILLSFSTEETSFYLSFQQQQKQSMATVNRSTESQVSQANKLILKAQVQKFKSFQLSSQCSFPFCQNQHKINNIFTAKKDSSWIHYAMKCESCKGNKLCLFEKQVKQGSKKIKSEGKLKEIEELFDSCQMKQYCFFCSNCHWEGKMAFLVNNGKRKSLSQTEKICKQQSKAEIKKNRGSYKTQRTNQQVELFRLDNFLKKENYLSKRENTEPNKFSKQTNPSNSHQTESLTTRKYYQNRTTIDKGNQYLPNRSKEEGISLNMKKTISMENQHHKASQHFKQCSKQSKNSNLKYCTKKPQERVSFNLKSNEENRNRSVSGQKRKRISFDIFNNSASLSSLKCKRISSKRTTQKEQKIISKLKVLRDKMASGELLLQLERKGNKKVQWEQIQKITKEISQNIQNQNSWEKSHLILTETNSRFQLEEPKILEKKHLEDEIFKQNGKKVSDKNKNVDEQKCSVKSLKEIQKIVWTEIDFKLSKNINPIAEVYSQIKTLSQQYGEKYLNALYLLYKKFFYIRASFFSSLKSDQQFILAPEITPGEWKKLNCTQKHQESLNMIKEENNKILANVQKLYGKLKEKNPFPEKYYEIVIEDDQIYEQFVQEMLMKNLQKYQILLQKVKENLNNIKENQVQALWRYGNAIKLAINDELGLEETTSPEKCKQKLNSISIKDLEEQFKYLWNLKQKLMQE